MRDKENPYETITRTQGGKKSIPDRTAGNHGLAIETADRKRTTTQDMPVIGQEDMGDGLSYRDKEREGEKEIAVSKEKVKQRVRRQAR